MKGKIYEDCVSYMKTTPFEITINSKIYSGTFFFLSKKNYVTHTFC